MHKIWVGIVTIVLFGVFFLFFTGDDVYITNLPPKNDTIIALGDSLVKGVGSSEGKDFVSVLGKKLGTPIINFGVAGDTTARGLDRIDTILREDPGTVIVLLGGNDAIQRKSINDTKTNLAEIIVSLQESGAVVVLLGVRSGLFGGGSYDDMYKDLSKTYGTLYVKDVLKGLFAKSEFMSDAIHPNDAGYAVIAERVYEAMAPILNTDQ